MLVSETFVNQTKGYQFGESEPYEPYTDNAGEFFREMQKEYGRCVSSVYVDSPDGPPIKVGWVFEKTMQYEDARSKNDTYIREVWVTLYERFERNVTIDREYHTL
jgi:hypothetical protein